MDNEGESAGKRQLHFRIRDTGIGIPADKQEVIFEAFRQADGSTSRLYGGTGLGLSISQRLVQQMGGRLWVESEVGKGSIFHFSILLPEAKSGIPRDQLGAAESLCNRRVLVVDDNETNRIILQTVLQNWGAQVTLATSGAEALSAVAASVLAGQGYDLILLDALMPEMDGFDVARAIKQKSEFHGPAIMMLSSAYRASDLQRCDTMGIQAVLTKPVGQRALLQAICGALAQQRMNTPPAAAPEPVAPIAHGVRVLVVEDNPINREVARGLLTKRGHHSVTVNDGAQAVAEWKKNSYDLILMDIQMPVMDGHTATRHIRAVEKTQGGHIPIIAMTAHALKGTEEECLSYGMDGYISKPLNRERFLALVEKYGRPTMAAPKAEAPKQPVVEIIGGAASSPLPVPALVSAQVPAAATSAEALVSVVEETSPLVQFNKMAEHIGSDPETQQQVVNLCLQALATKLPQLRRAMGTDDLATIQRISHYLRGSLGLLGLPALVKLGEEIEYHHDDLGVDLWRQRCEQFVQLLDRVNEELQQLRAA